MERIKGIYFSRMMMMLTWNHCIWIPHWGWSLLFQTVSCFFSSQTLFYDDFELLRVQFCLVKRCQVSWEEKKKKHFKWTPLKYKKKFSWSVAHTLGLVSWNTWPRKKMKQNTLFHVSISPCFDNFQTKTIYPKVDENKHAYILEVDISWGWS